MGSLCCKIQKGNEASTVDEEMQDNDNESVQVGADGPDLSKSIKSSLEVTKERLAKPKRCGDGPEEHTPDVSVTTSKVKFQTK